MFRRWRITLLDYLRTPPGQTPRCVTDDIGAEIESHLDHAIDEHRRRGMTAEHARQAAMSEFGNLDQALRDCHQVWRIDQRLCHWTHLTLTTLLLVALAYFSFTRTPPISMPVVDAGSGDLHGHVLDERSEAIAQAHILAVVKTWPPNGYRQQAYIATTGANGRFRIENVYPTDQKYEVQLAVVADRRLLESIYISDVAGQLAPFSFRLRSSEPVVVRFSTADGAPLHGVEVFPHRRVDASGQDNLVYFQGSEPVVTTTDADGIARLPYFGRGDLATVCFRVPGMDWQTRDVRIPRATNLPVFDLQVSLDTLRANTEQPGS
jgi:hypothetical protein